MMSVKSFLRLYCFLFASFGFSPEAKRELGQENQARLDAEAHGVEVEKKKKKKTKEETKGTSSVEQKGSLTQKVLDLFWKTDEGDSNTVGVGRTEIAKVKTENKAPVDSSLMQLGGFGKDFFTTPQQFDVRGYSYTQRLLKKKEDLAGIEALMAGVKFLEVQFLEGLDSNGNTVTSKWKYSFVWPGPSKDSKKDQVKLQWHAKHIEDLDEKAPVKLDLDEEFKNSSWIWTKALTYQLRSTVTRVKGPHGKVNPNLLQVEPTMQILKEGNELTTVWFVETEISKPEVPEEAPAKVKELEEAKKKLQEAKDALFEMNSHENDYGEDDDGSYDDACAKWKTATGESLCDTGRYPEVIAAMEKKVKEKELEEAKKKLQEAIAASGEIRYFKNGEGEESDKRYSAAVKEWKDATGETGWYGEKSYSKPIADMKNKIAALEKEIKDLSA